MNGLEIPNTGDGPHQRKSTSDTENPNDSAASTVDSSHVRNDPETTEPNPNAGVGKGVGFNAPGALRTHNPRLRRPVLYPIELRAQSDGEIPTYQCSPWKKRLCLVPLTINQSSVVISLTHGKHATIDYSDWPACRHFNWRARKGGHTWYAVTKMREGKKRPSVVLHQFVMGLAPEGLEIDHVDRNGLNNRKSNLRFGTHSQNCANSGYRRDTITGHRGVYRASNCKNLFCARIRRNGKNVHLGTFRSVDLAAAAYDAAAKDVFGGFSILNFPSRGVSALRGLGEKR